MHRTVYVKTTEACQLNCKHCFTGGNANERTYLDVEKTGKWIDELINYIGHYKPVHFELHGGEPFLAPVEMLKRITTAIRNTRSVNSSIGATTNLTYNLTEELLEFIEYDLDSIATSWDKGIRFANPKQEDLWASNLKKVLAVKPDVVLNVSVSRAVVEMDQEELIRFLRDTGCYKVQFDRITLNGSANNHPELFPTNAEINQWYLRMHETTVKLDARKWFYNSALEDVYAKFEKGDTCSGTFCRDCEESIFTLNADGTIGGCANSAPEEVFGNIDMSMEELFGSSKRIDQIVKERTRPDACLVCPVFSYCGSDCHRLSWEGDVCASPRQLMKKLAGLDYTETNIKRKTIIPIKAI